MGLFLLLAVVALGAIVWLLFRIDAKLQAIGDMIHDASRPEEQRRLNDGTGRFPSETRTLLPRPPFNDGFTTVDSVATMDLGRRMRH